MTPAAGPVIGPMSLIQGEIPADRRWRSLILPRRLEAVVLTRGRDALVHYFRDQSRPDRGWSRGEVISDAPLGAGALWQDPDWPLGRGALHAAVPELVEGELRWAHYSRENGRDESRRWRRVGVLDGPPRRPTIDGAEAFPGAVAVASASTSLGSTALLAAAPGAPELTLGGRGWRQALVQEGESVFQWHRQEWRGRFRWVRAGCLRSIPGDGFSVEARPSVKLAQVTGERDSQHPGGAATLSRSATTSGVRGTDLGVRVDHAGETFLLFGDTHWTLPWRVTRDAIGRLTPDGPLPGLPGVELHGAPLRIVGGPATSREYDVPLDGFSHDGHLFCFFSSHHFARHQTMGRSLLTRSVDAVPAVSGPERLRPVTFRHLGTFSDRYFVNVSVSRVGDRLFIWGSGSYRADDVRLAELDLTHPDARRMLDSGRLRRPQPGLRFFAGTGADGVPLWCPDEDAAAPVVRGAFGELSVSWVPEVGLYFLLGMEGPEDPIGLSVTLRTAVHPWGPWTPRRRLFDWLENGLSRHDRASRFIRASQDDTVGDAIFPLQRAMTGAAYAPYLFDTRLEAGDLVLRYTLSTWNPYQVVLMEHHLDRATLLTAAPGSIGRL